MKRKLYNALLPYEETRLNAIRQNSDYRKMTSNEVLSEIIAMDISKKNANELVARAHNARNTNLALKAKVSEESESDEDPMDWAPEDIKYSYHEHMVLVAKKFWGGNKARGPKSRDYSPRDSPRDNARYSHHDSSRSFSSGPREGQKARTCYNCGDKSHFIADCHFERREDNGGRLVRKDKSRLLSKGYTKYSSTKNLNNKNSPSKKPRAFVAREEYSSDDEDDEKKSTKEDEGVAIGFRSRKQLFSYQRKRYSQDLYYADVR